jgi:glycosyltransferase involved in cell wall biosynthesis
VDITLFIERQSPDPLLSFPAGLARRISIIELEHHSRSTAARHWRAVRRVAKNRPPLIDRFSGYQRQVAGSIAGKRYDLAIIEHIWCAPYIEQVRDHAEYVLLDAHNIESTWHAEIAKSSGPVQRLAFRRFARACRKFERNWLPKFDSVLVTSEDDAKRVPEADTIVYPNALPFVARPVRRERQVIVFTGNLEYEPNITAVRYFKEKIWPVVRERVPDVVWEIAGKNADSIRPIVSGDERICVSGSMDDAIATIARAKIAIVPLLSGSGTRFKILEAWAAGTPVISTRIGAEGLPYRAGEHLLICEEPYEFAEAIVFLLSAPEACAQLSEAGRELYEARYTWDSAWSTLDHELRALTQTD